MAFETDSGGVTVEVDAEANEASFNALADKIEGVLSRNLTDFQHVIGDVLKAIGRNAESSLGGATKGFKKAEHAARDYRTTLRQTDKQMLDVVRHVKMQTDAIEVQSAALKVLAQDINKERSASNRASEERQRLEITGRIESDRIRQAEMHAVRDANQQMRVETNNAGQLNLIRTREHGKQRIQIVRAVLETIARMEKASGAIVTGIAKTVTSALSRTSSAVGRALSSMVSRVRTSDRSLSTDISKTLTARESAYRSSFSRQERILSSSISRQRTELTRLNTQITSIRNNLSTGVLGAATGRGAGGGAGLGGLAAGGGLVALLTSGFSRFSDLERLNKQFLALTGNIETTNMLMAQVKEFAKLTPFDLVGVADLAKGFLAIGTAADKVMPQVKAIADAVALTGGGVDALNRIQRAIGQVVSAGRLQGDELNQLAENLPGLNIRKLLAAQLTGGDTRKLVDMQAAGEISADMFVKGLIDGLSTDPRLVGASEDLAKTLAGRVANLKESFADFGASLIGVIAGPLKVAVLTTQTALQGMADFIKGNVSPGLLILRDAAFGAAAGLAAMVAAKAAVEVIGLLGRSLAIVVTPMGLLVTASALLGAGFAVMLKHSVPFRIALDNLWQRLGEVGARIKELVGGVFTAFAGLINRVVIPAVIHLADFIGANLLKWLNRVIDFVTNTAIPAIGDFAGMLGRGLVTAFRETSTFIRDTVIPVLSRFVSRLRNEVFPIVADVARVVGRGFMEALGAVRRFGQRILPYIKPAIDGFIELGRSIAAAIGGDFSRLGAGALGVLTGIGSTVVGAWDAAFKALRPLAGKALDLIKSVFTLANLQSAFGVILDVVEWIGKTLGTIVTHPAFIAALATLALAAVQLGLRFAKGFVEGILSNIPTLFRIVKDAVMDNFLSIVLAAIVGVGVILPLVRAFRQMGAAGGQGFIAGFRSRVSNMSGFNQGLMGGDPRTMLQQNALRSMTTVARTGESLQRRLLTFGVQKLYDPNISGLRQMQADLKRAEAGLTAGQKEGLVFREGIASMGRVIKSVFSGPGAVRGALKDFWVTMRTEGTNGQTIGRMIGQKIASGMAVGVLSFFGGQMAGKAGLGATQSILTGLVTGAMLGGAPGAVAGTLMTTIGFAMGDASRRAEEARARLKALTDTIQGEFGAALKAGTIDVITFANALSLGQEGSTSKAILAQFAPATIALFNETGVSFNEVLEAFKRGPAGLEELKQSFAGLGWEEEGLAVQQVTEAYEALAGAIAEVNAATVFTRGPGFANRAAFEAGQVQRFVKPGSGMFGPGSGFGRRVGDFMGADREDPFTFKRAVGDSSPIFGPGSEAATKAAKAAFRNLADDSRTFYRNLRDANAAWDSFGDKPKPKSVEQLALDAEAAALKLDSVNAALDRAFRPRGATDLNIALGSAILAVKDSFDDIKIGGDIFDMAALGLALAEFAATVGEVLSPVIAADIAKGIIPSEEKLQAIADPILQALLATTDDEELRNRIFATWRDSIRAGANAAWAASGGGFDEAGIPTQPFDGLRAEVGADNIDVDTAAIRAKLRADGDDMGFNLMQGIGIGITRGKLGVEAVAKGMADNLVTVVRGAFGIKSPSTVFMGIGRFIGEGLEIGITESMAGVDAIMASAVDSAISAAVEASKSGSATLRSAGAALFGSLVGSGAPLGGGPALGILTGFTSSIAGFKSAVSSTVQQAFDVALKNWEKQPMSPADLDIFGESAFSLNPSDVLGAENIDSMREVIDNIVSFGSTLLEMGVPAADVVDRLKSMRDQFLVTAGALGFNVDEVHNLIDALGLSDGALSNFAASLTAVTEAAAIAEAAAVAAGLESELSDKAREIRQLTIEALTLSPADLAVFMRENGLGEDFWLNLIGLQADINANPERSELEELGRSFGYWGSALESFVATVEEWVQATNPNFTTEGGDPEQIGMPGSGVTHLERPPITVNVYPPYGDPLAIGLSAVNAVAAQAQVPGG